MPPTPQQTVPVADARDAAARSRLLLLFVVSVNLVALAAAAPLPMPGLQTRPGTALILAALAALVGSRPVRISILRTEVTATHPFIFCALATVGPQAANLAAVAGVLSAAALRAKRLDGFRLVFNVGAVLLSTTLAGWTFLLAGGVPGHGILGVLAPLAAAAGVYFVANTGFVAQAISLEKGQRLATAWQRSLQWTTVSFFAGLTLAIGLIVYLETMGAWALVLGIPPCWLLAAFYRTHKERTEEQERRIRQVERLNAELEQRVAERTGELQQALERIKELQALKGTLTQTLVHDLKNPLAVVVGNLDLLERQAPERARRLVERCKAGSSRMLRMILDLLDISGMEDGRFVVRTDPVDLSRVARVAAEEARVAAEPQRVTLSVGAPSEPCVVNGDASVLRRVLDNLLANALQHSPSGTTIRLDLVAAGGAIDVVVADQGPGIPEAYREKIFEKYAQVELRRAGVTANRGLGLTFCQLAVEAHGGSIRAEAAPGGGALIRTRLPAAEAIVGPEPSEPAHPPMGQLCAFPSPPERRATA